MQALLFTVGLRLSKLNRIVKIVRIINFILALPVLNFGGELGMLIRLIRPYGAALAVLLDRLDATGDCIISQPDGSIRSQLKCAIILLHAKQKEEQQHHIKSLTEEMVSIELAGVNEKDRKQAVEEILRVA